MIKKLLKIELTVIGIVFLLSFAGRPIQRHQTLWTSCYNSENHSLHFNPPGTASRVCQGQTMYQASKFESLIQSTHKFGIFSENTAGTKRSVVLGNGRQVLVSQWNENEPSSDIVVLEPNFRTHKVKQHCRIPNYVNGFETFYNRKNKTLYIKVDLPTNKSETKFKSVWKPCKL